MRWPESTRWRRRFAFFPLFVGGEGWVWLEPYWVRFAGDHHVVSFTTPPPSGDGP